MRLRRSIRWRLRSPVVFWLVAAVLAIATASTIARVVSTAEARAARYGSPRRVVLAARDIAAGAVVHAADVEVRRLPDALVPRQALADVPVGRAVVVPVFRGEVLLRQKLAPWGVRGVAATVPEGRRGVTLPSGPAPPPVRAGDVVDVVATFDAELAGEGQPTFAVAVAAPVLAVNDGTVTVAVKPDEVPRVVFAAATGVVSLVLRGAD